MNAFPLLAILSTKTRRVAVATLAIALVLGALAGRGCRDGKPLLYETIHEAAAKGDLADVKRHLRRGAVVNARDKYGSGITPLHAAAAWGHNHVVKYLGPQGRRGERRAQRGADAAAPGRGTRP